MSEITDLQVYLSVHDKNGRTMPTVKIPLIKLLTAMGLDYDECVREAREETEEYNRSFKEATRTYGVSQIAAPNSRPWWKFL